MSSVLPGVRWWILPSLLAALPTWLGCAAFRAAYARSTYLRSALESFEFKHPPEEVWPHAVQLLAERGFAPRQTGDLMMETDWLVEGSGSESATSASGSSRSQRYFVSGVRTVEGCRFIFTRSTTTSSYSSSATGGTSATTAPVTERDFDLELELVRRVEPDRASRLEADAEQHAEASAR